MDEFRVKSRLMMLTLLSLVILSSCSTLASSNETSPITSTVSEVLTTSESESMPLSSSETITSHVPSSDIMSSELETSSEASSSEMITSSENVSSSEPATSSEAFIWPEQVILTMFNGYTIPSYPHQIGDTLSYITDDVNRIIILSIQTTNPNAFIDYLHVLDVAYFHSYINYENSYCLSTNSGGNLNINFNYTNEVLSLTLFGVDYTYYESVFETFIKASNINFPTSLISDVYGPEIAQRITPFVATYHFRYYTRMLLGKANVVIDVMQSSLEEFSIYYNALWDDGWYMDVYGMTNIYTATDNINKVKLEVTFDEIKAITTISITLIYT